MTLLISTSNKCFISFSKWLIFLKHFFYTELDEYKRKVNLNEIKS